MLMWRSSTLCSWHVAFFVCKSDLCCLTHKVCHFVSWTKIHFWETSGVFFWKFTYLSGKIWESQIVCGAEIKYISIPGKPAFHTRDSQATSVRSSLCAQMRLTSWPKNLVPAGQKKQIRDGYQALAQNQKPSLHQNCDQLCTQSGGSLWSALPICNLHSSIHNHCKPHPLDQNIMMIMAGWRWLCLCLTSSLNMCGNGSDGDDDNDGNYDICNDDIAMAMVIMAIAVSDQHFDHLWPPW